MPPATKQLASNSETDSVPADFLVCSDTVKFSAQTDELQPNAQTRPDEAELPGGDGCCSNKEAQGSVLAAPLY